MMVEVIKDPKRVMLVFGSLCLGATSIAVVLGLIFNLEVCAMCWFQRSALLLAALSFFIAAIWSPINCIVLRIGELSLIAGWASSSRQVYLVLHPEAANSSCSAGLMYYLNSGNLEGFFKAGLLGGIECATEQAKFLGMHLPLLSLMAFSGIGSLYLCWKFLCTRFAHARS